jgi:hypothetical protein
LFEAKERHILFVRVNPKPVAGLNLHFTMSAEKLAKYSNDLGQSDSRLCVIGDHDLLEN